MAALRPDVIDAAPSERVVPAQSGPDAFLAPGRQRIQDDDDRNVLAVADQLPGHLQSDEGSIAVPSQEIRSGLPDDAQRADAISRHGFDRLRDLSIAETMRAHRIEGLVGAERPRQLTRIETTTAEIAMQKKERWARATRVQHHQRRF